MMETADVLKREIKVLAFDQYGTIVDMQQGLTEAVTPFLKQKGWDGKPNSFVTWWRRTHYENSMIDALCDRGHTPYRQIGHRALSFVMDRCGIAYTQQEVSSLVSEIEKLKPFADVVAALEKASVPRIQADYSVERRPRYAQGSRAAHRLSVRSCHFGAGGRLFQAALEDLCESRRDHQ
jgi:phosphoglycolate phosphatase-like HAD superfamily hydrolase